MAKTEKSIRTALFTLVLLLACAAVAQTPGEFPQAANVPKNMKQYFLCLLEKGEKYKPMQFADPEMQGHLAYIREQVEAASTWSWGRRWMRDGLGGWRLSMQRQQKKQRRS
jgi:hypothetical protein